MATRVRAGAALGAIILAGAGCGSPDPVSQPEVTEAIESSEVSDCAPLSVVAGFYPLQFIADSVVSPKTELTTLADAGVEPHDFELTPRQAAAVTDADLVVFLPTFMPSLDEAVAELNPNAGFDALVGLDLLEGHDHGHDHGHAHDDDHAEDHADDRANEKASGSSEEEFLADPHVWLDPANVSSIGNALAAKLSELDPACSAIYQDNAKALNDEMSTLDAEMNAALASCKIKTMVVSHEAFGYLANRYGFEQVGISGLVPDAEPSPKRLAEVAEISKADGVTTVYYETLVSPVVAEALAAELDIEAAKLDPIESKPATGDLVSAMRENLATLVGGQNCG